MRSSFCMSHLTASAGSRKKKGHGGVAGYMYAQTGTPLNSFSWQTASQIRTPTTVRILRSLDFPFAQPTTCSTGNAPVWVACYPTIIIVVQLFPIRRLRAFSIFRHASAKRSIEPLGTCAAQILPAIQASSFEDHATLRTSTDVIYLFSIQA